jgi:hypothetical protein
LNHDRKLITTLERDGLSVTIGFTYLHFTIKKVAELAPNQSPVGAMMAALARQKVSS